MHVLCISCDQEKPRAKPVKRILISKTIIPHDYTGNDHQEWKQQITLERMILSIKNESTPSLDLELEETLKKQNILKPINN